MTTTETPAAVDPEPAEPVPAEVLPAVQQHAAPEVRSAIDAAVEGALAMPGAPGRDEFLTLAAQARMLSLSGGAPKLIREDPYLAFHVVLVGRDLGISPSAAVELIDVIPPSGDRGPQLSLSPQLLNGQIRRLGLGSIVKAVSDEYRCIAVALEPGGRLDWRCKPIWPGHVEDCTCRGIMGDVEWTWEDARTAGLVGRECQPGDHKPIKQGDSRCGCRQGYKTYPKRMHWWRASGYAADDYFPEAGLGLYTAEELGALVDAEGRAIDVTNVELPPGYEAPQPPVEAKATGEQTTEMQVRIAALPEAQRDELRKRWAEKVTWDNGKPIHPAQLTAADYGLANTLLNGVEAQARAHRNPDGSRWDQRAAQAGAWARLAGAVAALLARPLGLAPESPDTPPIGTESDAGGAAPQHTTRAEKPGQAPASGPVVAPQPPDPDDLGSIDGATSADVDWAIAQVKAMTRVHEVDKALTARRLNAEGDANARRRRLAAALIRDRVAERRDRTE